MFRGALLAIAIGVGATLAQAPASPGPETIRIWGHGSRAINPAGDLVRRWNEAFARVHPGVRFEVNLHGDSAAIGGLYTGAADVALMGREIWPIEFEGFDQAVGGHPLEISVMTGSLVRPYRATALAIFVHKDNPLAGLTLAQADAIFGADHQRGSKNIRRWEELGLSGDWSGRPINLYGFAIRQDHAQFFEHAVMGGSQKWNCALREFGNDGAQILAALAQDRFGMALGSLAFQNPDVRALPLGAEDGRWIAPTRESVMTRQYPLARPVSMVIRRQARSPVSPLIRQYLEFLLSPDGQKIVAQDGNYLPLPDAVVREERGKLQ